MGSVKSIRNAQNMLDVAAIEGVDFQVLNGDDAFIDRFAHIDVLVAPAGIAKGKKTAAMRKAAEGILPRDVIGQIGGSRRQAEYRFREFVGKSIGEEILSVRLETAKKLLSDPLVPIGAVAVHCGYSDDSLLRKAFKSATGMSLSEYRESIAR